MADRETINGSNDNDQLWGDNNSEILGGFGGDDHLHGWRGDDVLFGGDGTDVISAGNGDDVLIADSEDRIYGDFHGGAGNDTLKAEDGEGTLKSGWLDLTDVYKTENYVGNAAFNAIKGTSGDNILDGGQNFDHMRAGAGDDILIVDNLDPIYTHWAINGGAGNDTLKVSDGVDLKGEAEVHLSHVAGIENYEIGRAHV